ncbi:ribbon-helix-helix protein, CopG family [bacterium]|nr:MAG: ribbon-helix-helix protein, CopG family [bacterium]
MQSTLTIRLDNDLYELLEAASQKSGRPKSELVRESLKKQLKIERFRELRENMLPYAEKAGFLTDDDIFNENS